MYRVSVGHTLLLALLGLLALTVMSCGGEPPGRNLPEDSLEFEGRRLPAGGYVSDEFRPAMSFGIPGSGWQAGAESYNRTVHGHRRLTAHGESVEMRDYLNLSYAPEGKLVGTIDFFIRPRVYRVVSSYEAVEEPAPEDIAAWLQQNPNLDAGEPEPATVGGEKGVRFEAEPSRVPEDYITCGYPCVPLFQTSDLNLFYDVGSSQKVEFVILDHVEGGPVIIAIKAGTARFDEFAPVAEKVLATVEWTGG